MAANKQTVVFDFDGVIHSYKSGWQGIDCIPDEPVEGIRDELKRIHDAGYEVAVVSTRCKVQEGMWAINDYLNKHDMLQFVDKICKEKPPAIVYIDDRAIRFDGNPKGLLEQIQSFKPWYQEEQ